MERTFSWLESFRRLNRNYEQFLHSANGIVMAACAQCLCCGRNTTHWDLTARTHLYDACPLSLNIGEWGIRRCEILLEKSANLFTRLSLLCKIIQEIRLSNIRRYIEIAPLTRHI